jgi:hypothetical protein
MRTDWWKTAKKILRDTPAEIAVAAGVLSAAFIWHGYNKEDGKRGQIPVAFSEIGQTKRVLGYRGLQVPPLTYYFSLVNDTDMQVFEANNEGYKWGWAKSWAKNNRIAYEMEKKVEPTMKVHTQIPEYAAQIPAVADAALKSLAPVITASEAIKPALTALDQAWDDHHNDVYHTEVYFETVCSSDGKGGQSCSPQMRTREVYDYTVHTYTYDKEQGELAAALLKDFQQKHPSIHIDEQLLLVYETNAENEWAIRESRKHMPGYTPPKGDDYVNLANTWATGSNYNVLIPKAYEDHKELLAITPQWEEAAPAASSTRYRTYSHSDSGPQEFQIAEAALRYAVDMVDKIDRTSGGIQFAKDNIPLLSRKIQEFVNVELHGAPGNSSRLLSEIMDLGRETYDRNFAAGFDTQPFKVYKIILWGLAGLLIGAGAGAGVDYYSGRKKWWGGPDGSHYRYG